MAQVVHPPRGMRDFLPAEKAHRDAVLARIVDSYTRHGFTAIETPVMEDISRLTSGMGGDNEKLAFRILRRGLHQDELRAAAEKDDPEALADLGLRYDLTVPLSRYYASHHAELPSVFKSIQTAPVWRAERPQKGRYRQFVQCDIDILGEPGVMAEIELVTSTADTLRAVGVSGFEFRINDRRLLDALLASLGFPEDRWPHLLISVDKLDKVGVDGVVAEVEETGAGDVAGLRSFLQRVEAARAEGGLPELSADAIRALLPDVVGAASAPALAAMESLTAITEAIGALPQGAAPRLVFDPTLVRGMGYYTGTIFEIAHPSSSSSVGGGGRYDGMVGRFLGRDVPACGFSIGFERIVDLVETPESEGSDGLVVLYDADADRGVLAGILHELSSSGTRVRLERRPRRLGPLLEAMAASGFSRFAILGEARRASDLEVRPIG